jgi:hypothetical protein
MTPKDFPLRILTGEKGGGGRGLIDFYVLKHDVKKHMLTVEVDKLRVDPQAKASMNEVFASCKTFRERLNPIPVKDANGVLLAKRPNLDWQAGWPRTYCHLVTFIEELVYGEDYDSSLRPAVRCSKTPVDVMEYQQIKAKLDELHALRVKELEQDASNVDKGPPADHQLSELAAGGAQGHDGDGDADTAAPGQRKAHLSREATRLLHSYMHLMVEPDNQTDIKHRLKGCPAGKAIGDANRACPPAHAGWALPCCPRPAPVAGACTRGAKLKA